MEWRKAIFIKFYMDLCCYARMVVWIFTLDCVRVFTKVQLCKGVDWIHLVGRGGLLLTC